METISKHDVNWQALRKDLVSSFNNEKLWLLGSSQEEVIEMHESNMREIAEDIVYIDGGYYDEVIAKHEPEWFNGFIK